MRTVLESRGLWATVQNENLAPYGVGAEVWVESSQTEEALAVLREIAEDDGGQLSLVEEDVTGRLATADPLDSREPPTSDSDRGKLERPDAASVCADCGAARSETSPRCEHCGSEE